MGYAFDETMSGTMTLAADPATRHPIEFRANVRVPWIGGAGTMTGTIDAGPLVKGAPFDGKMILRPFLGRVIRYELGFVGRDGKRYALAGQKDIRWLDARRTWTELPAELTDESGQVLGTAALRMNIARDWLAFGSSFRIA